MSYLDYRFQCLRSHSLRRQHKEGRRENEHYCTCLAVRRHLSHPWVYSAVTLATTCLNRMCRFFLVDTSELCSYCYNSVALPSTTEISDEDAQAGRGQLGSALLGPTPGVLLPPPGTSRLASACHLMELAEAPEGKPNHSTTFQAFAHGTLANILLTKASHKCELKYKGWWKYSF